MLCRHSAANHRRAESHACRAEGGVPRSPGWATRARCAAHDQGDARERGGEVGQDQEDMEPGEQWRSNAITLAAWDRSFHELTSLSGFRGQVKIRIRFADRTQLESTFPSDAPISAVYAFVRDSLDPTILASGKRFTLFTAPPRRDYPERDPKAPNAGLAQLGLIPAAVLSVRWDDATMNSE